MPSYSVQALVLRKTKLGETDTILTLLADDGRQVRAVAKGLRRPGSKYGARLEPYAVVDLLLHTGRTLDVISEARTVESNSELREDIDLASAAAVVVDLLDKIAVEGQEEPRLFGLATTTMRVMPAVAVPSLPMFLSAFLVKALAMHGYRPSLDECVRCAADVSASGSLSAAHGGMLCPACGDLDAAALDCAPAARDWLALILGSTMADVAVMDVPPAAATDCFRLVRAFVTYHIPARLKALDFYSSISGT